jgi:hypothetical protein
MQKFLSSASRDDIRQCVANYYERWAKRGAFLYDAPPQNQEPPELITRHKKNQNFGRVEKNYKLWYKMAMRRQMEKFSPHPNETIRNLMKFGVLTRSPLSPPSKFGTIPHRATEEEQIINRYTPRTLEQVIRLLRFMKHHRMPPVPQTETSTSQETKSTPKKGNKKFCFIMFFSGCT